MGHFLRLFALIFHSGVDGAAVVMALAVRIARARYVTAGLPDRYANGLDERV